eukprot:scaffold63_cov306-Pinguiococcus_pyrenoidosus.AAC.65
MEKHLLRQTLHAALHSVRCGVEEALVLEALGEASHARIVRARIQSDGQTPQGRVKRCVRHGGHSSASSAASSRMDLESVEIRNGGNFGHFWDRWIFLGTDGRPRASYCSNRSFTVTHCRDLAGLRAPSVTIRRR